MSKSRLLRGTVLLTITGVVVKLMGAAYRIPLSRLIGEEGMGLYQMAYPVYLVFLSVSTAGLPVAISKLVAEGVAKGDINGVRRLFRVSFLVLGLMGLLGSCMMGFGASYFSRYLSADPRSMLAMIALAPAVTFMAMTSALRGYFQGWQDMRPSGLSQMWEQGIRVCVLLTLAVALLPKGIEWAAAGAAFGATAGAFTATIFLGLHFWKFRREIERKATGDGRLGGSYRMWLKRLARVAFPIALGSILMPLMQAVDSLIVPGKLQAAGYTVSQATAALGQLGNAWAVLYLPLIVTSALSAGLVPSLSEAIARKSRSMMSDRLHDGYRLASWILPAASVGLLLMGKDIYAFIFAGQSTTILQTLAPGVFFLGWQQVSAAVLQGMGRPMEPLRHFFFGCIVKATLTIVLAGRPLLGIHGAAIATILGSAATMVLNLWAIHWIARPKGWFKSQMIPWIASGIMGLIGVLLCMGDWRLPPSMTTFARLGILTGAYFAALWCLGGINRVDIEGFRMNKKIASMK